jgi:hypothetical protein
MIDHIATRKRICEQTREFAASARWSKFPYASQEEVDHIARRSEACVAAAQETPEDGRRRGAGKVLRIDVTIVIESNL